MRGSSSAPAARPAVVRRHAFGGSAALVVLLTVIVGCGQVVPLAGAPHEAASSLPTPTVTPLPDLPGTGITPATVTPTVIVPPPGSESGGSGDTLLIGGAPTKSTFGMHVGQVDGDAWPSVPVGAFRIMNGDSTWGALEPSPGEWDFSRLDQRVDQARARGAPVLLVLSHPPAWAASRPDLQGFNGSPSPPRDIEEWRRYVTTVATRYAGRIEAYEVWNEPNLAQFFVGTPQQLGELTRVASEAINAVDSRALVVSAGFSARTGGAEPYFRAFVASGIASAIDVVGIHIYPYAGNGPESMVGLAQRFRAIANAAGLSSKPMWNTEIGYGRTPDQVISPTDSASLILRTYLVLPAAGLVRNYWYMWDDRQFVGLYLVGSDGRSPTSAGYRFGEAQTWVAGSQIDQCGNLTGPWICTLRHADGPNVTIAWSLTGARQVTVPAGATIAYTFGGDSQPVTAGAGYTVSATPVMFAPSALPSLD